MNTKTIVATLGGAAALVAGSLYHHQATLESDILTAEDYKFMEFVTLQGRSFATKAEFQLRSKIFKSTLSQIETHNNGNNTSRVGVNFLADRTESEKKMLTGFKFQNKPKSNIKILDTSNLDESVDWREKGGVTPVKNQGQCGSCWAFSTTGAVEGAMFVKTGKLESYSEQQLVDCAGVTGNEGCNGGLMDDAFKYIETNPLELEGDYTYTAKDGTCSYDKSKGVGLVAAFADVAEGSASQLQAALSEHGPVSVAIEADQFSFQMYTSGVLTKGCGTNLDHGVLAVGYGTENDTPYFIVKNSWGASWGDHGYIKIGATDKNDVCGILLAASYPTE